MSPETTAMTVHRVTRREFLSYLWGATMALFVVEAGGVTFLYARPRFKAGEFGGQFTLGRVGALPAHDTPPVSYTDGKFWLVNTEAGLLALYKVCTHLGCLYGWSEAMKRFECPCHGSKFRRDGAYIEGPAPRDLDRFVIQLVDDRGQVVAQTDDAGHPLAYTDPNLTVVVDTGKRIEGRRHE